MKLACIIKLDTRHRLKIIQCMKNMHHIYNRRAIIDFPFILCKNILSCKSNNSECNDFCRQNHKLHINIYIHIKMLRYAVDSVLTLFSKIME